MFNLPNELPYYDKDKTILFYHHKNSEETNNSKIHFNQFCISIGVHGTKKLKGSNGVEEFGKGDIILYRPGNFISYENIDHKQAYQSLMIFFDEKIVLNSLKSNDFKAIEANTPDIKTYYAYKSDAYILHYLESIEDYLKNKKVFTVGLQKAKLVELFAYLQSISTIDLSLLLNTNLKRESQKQLVRIIKANTTENVPLEELAFMCNMSLSTFKRSFKKHYGISPRKWLNNKRFKKIEAQLKEGDKSPFEIFITSGYKDYSSFSHAFKKHFGYSPKEH